MKRIEPSRRRAAIVQLSMGYVGIAVSIAQGIIMVPLYLRHFDARLYGLWLATGGITVWLGMLDFGVSALMGQRIAAAYGRKDYVAIGLYYFNGLLLQSFLVMLVLVAAAGIAWWLPALLSAASTEIVILRRATFLACLATGCAFLNNGQKHTADALQRPLGPMIGLNVGGLITIATIVVLLHRGHGLISLPIGMLLGSSMALVANFFYVTYLVRHVGGRLAPNRGVLIDMLKLSPSLLAAKIGGALVSRIEPTLVSLFVGPEMAVSFSLTKRAAEIGQTIVDRIVGAVTAGFAHLYAEGDLEKAAGVLRTTVSLCLGAGVVCLSVYLACNRSFVALWVGLQHYAGNAVTMLVAASLLSLVFNNLFSVLLGATGDIAAPCWMQLAEALCRLTLMAALLPMLGMAGLPLAVLLSTSVFAVWYAKRLYRRLAKTATFAGSRGLWLAGGALAFAALSGLWWRAPSWPWLVGCAALVAAMILLILIGGDPQVRGLRARLLTR